MQPIAAHIAGARPRRKELGCKQHWNQVIVRHPPLAHFSTVTAVGMSGLERPFSRATASRRFDVSHTVQGDAASPRYRLQVMGGASTAIATRQKCPRGQNGAA